MRALLLAVVLAWSPVPSSAVAGPSRPGPNFVFVLADDLGYGDLSCHGNPVFKTPALDRIHEGAVRFTDFCVSATCSPTRAALMTGRHEFRSGVTHTVSGRERLALDAVTLPQTLKAAGYATGLFGKWHLGAVGEYRPERRGFDVAVTAVGDTQNSHFDPVLLHNGAKREHRGYREDILFSEAIAFIRANRGRPFFCYVPTYAPHEPLRPPPEWIERCRKEFPGATPAPYFAMVMNLDANIGRLLAVLEELDLERETVVVVMNDNGATYGVDRWNAGMRGCKGASWFGGHRAISFWRWPGRWQPRDEGRLTAHVDLLPTFAELAGAKPAVAANAPLDGRSLRPLLESAGAPWDDDRMLFQNVGRWPSGHAADHAEVFCGVRWRNQLLVRAAACGNPRCEGGMCDGTVPWRTRRGYTARFDFHYALTPESGWALYDVQADPACERDLAAAQPETVARLREAYWGWWKEVLPAIERAEPRRPARASSGDE